MSNQQMSVEQVAAFIGISATSVRRMCDASGQYFDAGFPQPMLITRRKKVWSSQAVMNWLASRQQ